MGVFWEEVTLHINVSNFFVNFKFKSLQCTAHTYTHKHNVLQYWGFSNYITIAHVCLLGQRKVCWCDFSLWNCVWWSDLVSNENVNLYDFQGILRSACTFTFSILVLLTLAVFSVSYFLFLVCNHNFKYMTDNWSTTELLMWQWHWVVIQHNIVLLIPMTFLQKKRRTSVVFKVKYKRSS